MLPAPFLEGTSAFADRGGARFLSAGGSNGGPSSLPLWHTARAESYIVQVAEVYNSGFYSLEDIDTVQYRSSTVLYSSNSAYIRFAPDKVASDCCSKIRRGSLFL